ncbi:MAG: glycoside hydrolase [Candidatus Obscuribacterales bacterium]|nr:glycoside hydrolase [Candidatus Obscuribacterales bacterium]
MAKPVSLLIGTRKGAFILKSDNERRKWTLSDPIFLGHIIYHIVSDPRQPKNLIMAAKTGHLGPTVYHSQDGGKSWREAKNPPAFPKLKEEEKGRAVEVVFWLSPGHECDPNKWYAGTSPPGIFESNDNGDSWQALAGFNDNPDYAKWTEIGATPGGQLLHSINIHPQNPEHMIVGISVGGVFASEDKGKSWFPMNKGCYAEFLPDPDAEYGHDPHLVVQHPVKPERYYQQNHCGIYRLDLPLRVWKRIGDNMPREIGDIGFPIVLHPKNANKIWVFPMDGSTVWPRTSPGGKPAVYMSDDAGESWKRQDKGLPRKNAYFTVKRQAMCSDYARPLGLYFGNSQGEVWASSDEGASWKCISRYLPEIYSVTVMR